MRDSNLSDASHQLLLDQTREWPLMRDNLAALKLVRTRDIDCGEFVMRLQFNPGRIASSGAKIDPKTIRERKCFLCAANRPPEQRGLPFGEDYTILCNPFPIFPEHFTIPHRVHRDQRIADSFGDLIDLARAMSPRYTVFYNGPKSGASAPDHLHFQAGDRGWMTIEGEYNRLKGAPIVRAKEVATFAPQSLRPFIGLESMDRDALVRTFQIIHRNFADIAPDPDEPMMNVLAWFEESRGWRVLILPRAKHRPSFYFAEGDEKILLSPGSVDLAGVCIIPVERDYHRITRDHIEQMLREVMLSADRFAQLTDALRGAVG